jgi:hypothetical protein
MTALMEFATELANASPDGQKQLQAKLKMVTAGLMTDDQADAVIDSRRRFAGTTASKVKPALVKYLWEGWVALGALNIEFGEEGLGKGVVAADIAARTSTGTIGDEDAADVLWVTFEDAADSVIRPRLEVAGADLERVHIIDGGEDYESPLILPDQVQELAEEMTRRQAKLLIIDPLSDALREGLSDNSNIDVRRGLVPLQEAARAGGWAALGLLHPNKGATSAANKIMGSKAWRSVPRSVCLLGKDPEDEKKLIWALNKTNSARRDRKSLRAHIEAVAYTVDGEATTVPRIVFDGECDVTDSQLIAFAATGQAPGQKPETQKAKAEDLILKLLEGHGGEMSAEDAYAAGGAVGLSEATMRRARARLKIDADGHRWAIPNDWELPMDL